jgi:hypothetical protein
LDFRFPPALTILLHEVQSFCDCVETFVNDAWLEYGNLIIDVTADQFGKPPILITTDSSWHRLFGELSRRPLGTYDDEWTQKNTASRYSRFSEHQGKIDECSLATLLRSPWSAGIW